MKKNFDLKAYIQINGSLPKTQEDLEWWFAVQEKYATPTKEEAGYAELMEEEEME
jgi:hypothetical protein